MEKRASGILVHPTSFPSPYGIGDLGTGAYQFIDFLEEAKQELWQILPLGPTSFGDSPYQSFSTFAGNHYMISPDILHGEGFLTKKDLENTPQSDPMSVDYGPVIEYKMNLFRTAYKKFKTKANATQKKAYTAFCKQNKEWLSNYTLFVAAKNHFIEERRNEMDDSEGVAKFRKDNSEYLSEDQIKDYYYGAVWGSWPKGLVKREKKSIAEYTEKLADEIDFHKFLQYEFFRQWNALKAYANEKGIKIIGDIPIFVAWDSSDVWAEPELFILEKDGSPTAVAGVPPDYFSATGQLWGNPLYDWAAHKKQGYDWWIQRISSVLKMVDIVRIDHFRGFESYWAIPYGEKTAINGKWVKGPGKAFFTAISKEMGDLPIIAEDLGILTDQVVKLREGLGLPGMKVLQFSFSPDGKNHYIPHNFADANTVVYTGTHDNDTTMGWYYSAPENEKDYMRRYLNVTGEDAAWDLIRLAWLSVAGYAIAPIQDLFSMGGEWRMNTPGVPVGNWKFRYKSEMLTSNIAERLAYLGWMYNRLPEPKPESKQEPEQPKTQSKSTEKPETTTKGNS